MPKYAITGINFLLDAKNGGDSRWSAIVGFWEIIWVLDQGRIPVHLEVF